MINDYIYLFNIITQIKLRTSVLGRLRDLQYIFAVIYETRSTSYFVKGDVITCIPGCRSRSGHPPGRGTPQCRR